MLTAHQTTELMTGTTYNKQQTVHTECVWHVFLFGFMPFLKASIY